MAKLPRDALMPAPPNEKMARGRVPQFGRRLHQFIRARGGVALLCAELGVQRPTVQRWLDGDYEPSLKWVCILASYLKTTPNELLGVENGRWKEAHRLGVGPLLYQIAKERRRVKDTQERMRLLRYQQEMHARLKAEGIRMSRVDKQFLASYVKMKKRQQLLAEDKFDDEYDRRFRARADGSTGPVRRAPHTSTTDPEGSSGHDR